MGRTIDSGGGRHAGLSARSWTLILLFTRVTPAYGHPGQPILPHDLWRAWTLEAGVLLSLGIVAMLYSRGIGALWGQGGVGTGIRRWEVWAFGAGWLTLVLSLISPLHALGDSLFSAHMGQHELMMAVAAPLIVLGRPLLVFLWAIPIGSRRMIGGWSSTAPIRTGWRALSRPSVAWLIHAAAIWGWHLPGPYQLSLRSELAHTAQHATFVLTGLLFWWALVDGQRRARYGAAVLYLFTTAIHTGALGALLTFARDPWYPAYADTAPAWGMSPLQDQQLAGVVMWIPAGLSYLLAGLFLFNLWLRESDRRVARWEGRSPDRASLFHHISAR